MLNSRKINNYLQTKWCKIMLPRYFSSGIRNTENGATKPELKMMMSGGSGLPYPPHKNWWGKRKPPDPDADKDAVVAEVNCRNGWFNILSIKILPYTVKSSRKWNITIMSFVFDILFIRWQFQYSDATAKLCFCHIVVSLFIFFASNAEWIQ